MMKNILNSSEIINIQQVANRETKRKERLINAASTQKRIIINVSGRRFETHKTTLDSYPNTLLGNHRKRKPYYDKVHNEYFFDRHQASFHSILYYYQSKGRLRRPQFVPLDTFLEEVTFFELGSEILNKIRSDENIKDVEKIKLPRNRFRRHLWANMEYPQYSITAKIINIVSILMIFLSCIAFALETLPQYSDYYEKICRQEDELLTNESLRLNLTISYPICTALFYSPFFIIQTITVAFFTIEFLLRFISAPSYCDFIKSILNWIDLVAIIPYYVALGIDLSQRNLDAIQTSAYVGLRLLRIVRFTRVLKIYRVFRSFKTLRVLASAVKESLPDIFILISSLTILGFLFGAAVYFAENSSNGGMFDSIPKATYWGIITITSTGYGDIYPITAIGRIFASLCAVFGTATIGMLVSVLVDRYQRVFTRKLYIKEHDESIELDEYADDDDEKTHAGLEPDWHNKLRNSVNAVDPDARTRKEQEMMKYSGQGNESYEQDQDEVDDNLQENDFSTNIKSQVFIL
ncbi:unnamed protein product [Didymodactylos carnosus]|uniref:BTB domain-containing protein n=1 Tax=Didymodactylos carnosus TaxID=1234261 RepID=A0A814PAP6_9BILA|nr:unnamed protein product [Didymodactylos carnosus]CAF1102135.1 unnamed protein product [Didymodactylos carnosus]CAF3678688.1 unnamed protein product [Didymodactylos carnosus]CAF3866970.1 unnamed protein product [Didymodactylos carnosus]